MLKALQSLPVQAGGVLLAYTAYGYYQEKIMTTDYGMSFYDGGESG